MKDFEDVKIGDICIVFDEYSHDYIQHCVKVESIEYDKDFVTETNPTGKHCYGVDIDEEDWGDDYITQVTESNFINIKEVTK